MFGWLREPATDSITESISVIAERTNASRATRRGSFLYVTGCYALVGHTDAALIFATGLVFIETMLILAYSKNFPATQTLRNIDALRFGLVELTSTIFYTSLGIFAAFSDSISMVLVGVLWVVGVLNYCSINFAKWQFFNVVNVLPSGIGLVLFAVLVGSKPLVVSTPLEWVFGIIATLILLKTTQELIFDQRGIEHALVLARQDAADRLEALEFIADHDDLTGLLNRAAFNTRLNACLDRFQNEQKSFSLLLLDLNGFKPINDGFGHPAGDAILTEVSGRLRNTVGKDGFVARVGGDEFAVVLTHTDQPEVIEDTALDLIRVIGLPVNFNEVVLSVGVSIGAVICNEELNTPERMIAASDEALYRAKENNKSTMFLYDPSIARKRIPVEDRHKIELAIKDKLIKPYYQPKFCLKTRKVLGFEALARWPLDPSQPSESASFVSTIEQMGLLGEFTYHMARQVLADVTRLIEEGYNPGQVSLNLPEVTLSTLNGLEDLEWLLAEHPSAIPHITLEITEDVFIARSGERIRESIRILRDIGVRISLDDFGTGFASFQHLRQLEFDELKIDTEFVRGLGIDPTANVIVDGFLSIAQGLGVSVVAEGVETEAQREYLLERGCPMAQGFLHSKAQPLDQIHKYLSHPSQKEAG